MKYHKIPDEAVQRLPVYLRGVRMLSGQGHTKVSSGRLAEFIGINPWQIRKDFSYFGEFGTPGVGYDTEKLQKHICRILKLNTKHKTVIVGVGNLASALLTYRGFDDYGFDIVAAFDNNRKKIGKKTNGIIIEDITEIKTIKKRKVELAIITVPAPAAQEIADVLVDSGIRGILNFSPVNIAVGKKVKVISIDIAMDLARLPYYMSAG
jgi:redox-sensing transcriptional repressor